MKNTLFSALIGFIVLFPQTGYSKEQLPDVAPMVTTVLTRIVQSENDLTALINEVITLSKTRKQGQLNNINPLIDNLWVVQTICKYERQIWELMSLLNQKDAVTRNYLSYRIRMMQDSLKLIDIRLDLVKTKNDELVTTRDIFLTYEKAIQTVTSVRQRFESSTNDLKGLIREKI